jgi:hypothetical protein
MAAMSEHLPECPFTHSPKSIPLMCICAPLRAAEQRDPLAAYNRGIEQGQRDERASLWRLIEPLVTEIAFRNGTEGAP